MMERHPRRDSRGYRDEPSCRSHDNERNVLALNVLLLGNHQSGTSSVGNALIGEQGFQTGISTTTECRLLSRTFRGLFRRKGAESDLRLRVLDTPPGPRTPGLAREAWECFPGGVHVLVLVARAVHAPETTELEERARSLIGPDWLGHSMLVLTHADSLEEAGLTPHRYLSQPSGSLRALSDRLGGGVVLLDNSCDWPWTRGEALRDRLLQLSARNHHSTVGLVG